MLGTLKDCWSLVKWALKIRIALLLLQALLHVIPDHQGSMEDVFMKLYRTPDHPFIVERLFGGLDNWDAEYFIFNAHSGYAQHEQTMAFFPFLPMAMWTISKTLLLPLTFLMPQRSVILISGTLLNLLAFPLAVTTLYLLSVELTRNKKLSLLAAGLFCINPAGVFMSAVYSESLFALWTFLGLLALEKNRTWLSVAAFSMSSLTRSNGVVLSGFVGYRCLEAVWSTLWTRKDLKAWERASICIRMLAVAAMQCVVVVAPFLGFQYYGYTLYCSGSSTGALSSPPKWCNSTFPLPYSHIQRQYWDVGFLRYYQWKQLPNFLLATPVVVLSAFCAGCYFTGGKRLWSRNMDGKTPGSNAAVMPQFLTTRLRPYVVHLLFLLIFGLLNMHVQVLTRFLCSSSPVLYWIPSLFLLQALSGFQRGVGFLESKYFTLGEIARKVGVVLFKVQGVGRRVDVWISKTVVIYFISYTLLGFTLHCNFLPWT